jgi:hypothetical protein
MVQAKWLCLNQREFFSSHLLCIDNMGSLLLRPRMAWYEANGTKLATNFAEVQDNFGIETRCGADFLGSRALDSHDPR